MDRTDGNPLLSILLPTYNGASKYIEEVLDSLVKGVELCDNNELEIIVSNNASTDNTETILRKYEDKPYFKFYTNKENIGFARNIILLTDNYAHGIYGWVIGDDDLIAPKSLPFIIRELREGRFDYLSVGFQFIHDKKEMNTGDIQYVVNPSSYAQVLEQSSIGNTLGTFMSSAIFRRSYFCAVPKHQVTELFDTFQSVFPNGYVNATAFFDKKCAFVSNAVVFPIIHRQDWATNDNNYMIWTHILPSFYKYLCSLGIQKKELKKTYCRILHNGLSLGYGRLLSHKNVDRHFFSILVSSLFHPYVHFLLIRSIISRRRISA